MGTLDPALLAEVDALKRLEQPPSNGHAPLPPDAEPTAALDDAGAPACTDLGNAARLILLHGRDIRYCYALGRWFVWDGKRWHTDEGGAIARRAKATVRSILAEAADAADDEAAKVLGKHALRSQAEARIRAMVELAKSEPNIPVTPDQFDRDPWLLNVQNGTLDLRTGTLREHRRDDYITKLVPIIYDEGATCPTFETFISDIFAGSPSLITFVKRFIGYCLTGDTREEVLVILWGMGANGKSTLQSLLLDLLGEDFALQTPASTLMAKRGEGIPNDVARLRGARLVTAVETDEGRSLSEALVKQATGGDRMAARFMRAEWFDFTPTFKLWLATNHKPVIRGTNHAIWRRIRLIPFTVTFAPPDEVDADPSALVQDKQLPQKLRAEMPGILRWAVEGCLEWQREGLGMPEEVRQATEGYRAEMDVLAAWIGDCCILTATARTPAKDLYASYSAWCAANGEKAEPQRSFGQRLTERGHMAYKSGSTRGWKGIALRAPEDGPPYGQNGTQGQNGTHDSVSPDNDVFSRGTMPKHAPQCVPVSHHADAGASDDVEVF